MSEQGGPSLSKQQLEQLIQRVEKLEDEKQNLMEDIKEVYKEAKFHGFDTAIMKKMIKLRKMDNNKLEEEDYLTDLYRSTLGI